MKKMLFFAALVIMIISCTVFTSCDDYIDSRFGEGNGTENSVTRVSCEVTENVYSGTGVVSNIHRAPAKGQTPEQLDGVFTALSRHEAKFKVNGEEQVKTYSGTNKVLAYDVNKPRYARRDIFSLDPTMASEPVPLPDGREMYLVSFGSFTFSLVEESIYDTDLLKVGGKEFSKCENSFYSRQLVDWKFNKLNRDSADWEAYQPVFTFLYTLEDGPDAARKFDVTMNLLWVAKEGTDPDIPDTPKETVSFETRDMGFDYVNDSTSNSWQKIWRVFSDGTSAFYKKVEILLKNTFVGPAYQVKTVSDLAYESLTATKSSAVKGSKVEKPGNCYCYNYTQSYTTRTTRCDAIFTATYQDGAYWVDSLGVSHEFLTKTWSFNDKGWTDKALAEQGNYERKLLTSNTTGSFNSHTHTRKGEVELRKRKDSAPTIVEYDYKNLGIRPVKPMQEYFTYATQVAVYSDGSKEDVGEVGTTLKMTVTAPEKQVITVTDWNIADAAAKLFDAVANGTRTAKEESGTFTISNSRRDYRTATNKSQHTFNSIYDSKVVFKDKFGKEVEFPAITLAYTDKGGVATLRALQEADGYERKAMTTTIEVKAINKDTGTYTGEVEFRKKIAEQEELLSWDHTESLTYSGNGKWNTVSNITYHWKVQGDKTEVVSQTIEWSLTGEGFKTITLDAEEDPLTNAFVRVNEGAWSSETSSAGTQTGVTVYTKTNSSISETYKHVTDKYTAKRQRAVLNKTVGGKTVKINLLAPTDMTFSHKTSSLVDGGETTDNGTKYHVWKHTGNLVANVTASNDTRSESGTVKKDIRVKMEDDPIIIPDHPEWGNPVKLMGATLVYRPGVGNSAEGAFHKNLIIGYEKGFLVVTTKSFGQKRNNWNPMDFSYESTDFYYYGSQYWGKTLTTSVKVNSALLRDDKWEPALITMDGSGWVYKSLSGAECNMDQNLAITAGIKNFDSETTAENNPNLRWSGRIESGVLNIYNAKGVKVLTFK